MNSSDSLRILPEIILTLTGVLVMLIDASMPVGWQRRPLGWVAALGTTVALWASLWQLNLPHRHRLLRHRRNQPLHRLLPRPHLRHRAGRAPSCARHSARRQPPSGRILRAGRFWRRRHVPAHQRRRTSGGLHRARNLLHLHLHPCRLPQTHRPGPRSRHQILPARLLCHRRSCSTASP